MEPGQAVTLLISQPTEHSFSQFLRPLVSSDQLWLEDLGAGRGGREKEVTGQSLN